MLTVLENWTIILTINIGFNYYISVHLSTIYHLRKPIYHEPYTRIIFFFFVHYSRIDLQLFPNMNDPQVVFSTLHNVNVLHYLS